MGACWESAVHHAPCTLSSPCRRGSFRPVGHRPAAVHWNGDGAGLEGPGTHRGRPCAGILPGPERNGHDHVEGGQRKANRAEAAQGPRRPRNDAISFARGAARRIHARVSSLATQTSAVAKCGLADQGCVPGLVFNTFFHPTFVFYS